jgi:hypothetical protein
MIRFLSLEFEKRVMNVRERTSLAWGLPWDHAKSPNDSMEDSLRGTNKTATDVDSGRFR